MLKFIIALLIPIQIVFSQEVDKFLKIDKTNSILFNQDLNDKKGLFPGIKNLYKGSILKQADTNRYYAWLLLKADSVLKDSIIWLDDNKVKSVYESLFTASKFISTDSSFTYNILSNRAKLMSIYNGRNNLLNVNKDSTEDYYILNSNFYEFEKEYINNYNKVLSVIKIPNWIVYTDDNDFFKDVTILGIKKDKLVISQYNNNAENDLKSITKMEYKSSFNSFLGVFLGITTGIGLTYAAAELASVYGHEGHVFIVAIIGLPVLTILGGIIGGNIGSSINDVEIDLNYKDYYDKLYNLKKDTYFTIPDSSSR